MRKEIALIIVALFTITTGCTIASLQRIDMEGAPVKRGIRITEKNRAAGDFELHAYAAKNMKDQLSAQVPEHTMVNGDGIFQIEPVSGSRYQEWEGTNTHSFEGTNFVWRAPEWQGGVEIDFPLSDGFALTGGMSYVGKADHEFWDQNFGFGFFRQAERWAWRFDVNFGLHRTRYNALIVKREGSFGGDGLRDVYLFNVSKRQQHYNIALMFTANSHRKDWPFNYFFNYAIGSQRLYDFDEDFPEVRISSRDSFRNSPTFNTAAGGIYMNVSSMGRILLGARITVFTGKEEQFSAPDVFIQYDFRLH